MKYRLTDETIRLGRRILHRIECIEAFAYVKAGDKGGWIEEEGNLSQKDGAWVYGNAKVYGNAQVKGNAEVFGDAEVYGNAQVFGDAQVHGHAEVYGKARVYDYARVCDYAEVFEHAVVNGLARVNGYAEVKGDAKISQVSDYIVFKNNFSSGRYFTWTRSNNMWAVGCFYGTGDELIKKARLDSKVKARYYALYVKLMEDFQKVKL